MRAVLSCLAILTLSCGAGPVKDTIVLDADSWAAKIDMRLENGPAGDFLFILQSRAPDSLDWQTVETFRSSTRADIRRRDCFKLAGPSAAYFYLGRDFLVTTDSGRSWSRWSPKRDMKPPCGWFASAGIYTVDIAEDGTGRMVAGCGDEKKSRLLTTSSYGKRWRVDDIAYDRFRDAGRAEPD